MEGYHFGVLYFGKLSPKPWASEEFIDAGPILDLGDAKFCEENKAPPQLQDEMDPKRVCTYIYIYIYIYTRVYVYIYIYTTIYLSIYLYIYISLGFIYHMGIHSRRG